MERLDLYRQYTEKLLAEGKAYYCFCTPEELEAEKDAQMAKGETPVYGGTCSHLSEEQIKQYLAEGRPHVIRIRTPKHKTYEVDDIVRGKVPLIPIKSGISLLLNPMGCRFITTV